MDDSTHHRGRLSRAHALAAAAGAVAATMLPRGVRAQMTATLRVGASPVDSYAEAYFAQDAGIFAKYNLPVEITPFPNAAAIVAAAAGNAIDIGMADMIQLVNPVQRGVAIGYIAGGAVYHTDSPTTLLVASKSTTFAKPKDFEGQTIGVVALNSISSMCVSEWLRTGGADLSKVKIYELPFSTMQPALERNTIAAAFLAEPFLSASRGDLRVVTSAYDTIAKECYIGAWFTTRDWLTKNPEVARRLLAAINETARYANAHHDETAVTLSKVTKIDVERVKAMTRAVWGTTLDPKLMQPVIDLAARYKVIDRTVNASDLIYRT